MVPESEYPYTAFADKCFVPYDGKIKVLSYTTVPAKSATALKTAIAKQPVSVTVAAGGYAFQHYINGVITDTTCGTALDHAILAVGYGVENGVEYYIVKNSWGTGWGDKGYIKLAMVSGKGICGVQMEPLYPNGV